MNETPQTLEPTPYQPKHWHWLIWLGVFILALLIGGLVFLYSQNSSTQPATTSQTSSATLIGYVGDGEAYSAWTVKNGHVYENDVLIDTADVGTFSAVKNENGQVVCVKDKNYVWFWPEWPHPVTNSSDVVATGGFCKDTEYVWIGNSTLEGADAATFIGISNTKYGGYGKDKNVVYYYHSLLESSDPVTFELVKGNGYNAQDKNHKYLNGEIVQ